MKQNIKSWLLVALNFHRNTNSVESRCWAQQGREMAIAWQGIVLYKLAFTCNAEMLAESGEYV